MRTSRAPRPQDGVPDRAQRRLQRVFSTTCFRQLTSVAAMRDGLPELGL